jgi:hypothetical protein
MKLQKSEIKPMVDMPSLQASEVKKNSKIQLVKRDSEDFAKEVDTKFGNKLLLTCTWNNENRVWFVNKTTQNDLIDKLGNDTETWINQEIDLRIESLTKGSDILDIIYLKK